MPLIPKTDRERPHGDELLPHTGTQLLPTRGTRG
jgi:hypothetical protein